MKDSEDVAYNATNATGATYSAIGAATATTITTIGNNSSSYNETSTVHRSATTILAATVMSVATSLESETEMKRTKQQYSQGSRASLRYALILEDDAYVPNTLLKQLVSIIINSPIDIGTYFLDDSFHNFMAYAPPPSLHESNSPYPNSYTKNISRTSSAYLISQAVLEESTSKGLWGSIAKPIDLHFDFIIGKLKVRSLSLLLILSSIHRL
jgi:hypothetical protein